MVSQHVKFVGPQGMHMRPAQILVTELGKYDSTITILFGEKVINAKSIMGVMAFTPVKGMSINIITTGNDEHEALYAVENFLTQR